MLFYFLSTKTMWWTNN